MPKLTADTVQRRIDIALLQEKERKIRYNKNINLFLNKQAGGDEDAPPSPNFVYATTSQLVATMLDKDPKWASKADTAGYEEQELLLPAVVSKLWRIGKFTRQMRQVLLSAIIMDFGAVKLGMGLAYAGSEEEQAIMSFREKALFENMQMLAGNAPPVDPTDRHDIEILIHQQQLEDPDLLTLPGASAAQNRLMEHIARHMEFYHVPSAPQKDLESYAHPDYPFCGAIMPIDLYWETGATFFDEANYVLHRSWHHEEDLKGHPLLDQKAVKNAKAEELDQSLQALYTPEEWESLKQSDDGMVATWELWDWRTKTRSLWLSGSDRPLLAPSTDPTKKWPYKFVDKYPINLLVLSHAPGRTHGRAPIHYLEHNQRLEMETMAAIALHVRRSIPKYQVDVAMLDKSETLPRVIEKLKSGAHGGIIFVDSTKAGAPPGAIAIRPIETAPMDISKIQLLNLLEKARPVNSGLSDTAQGVVKDATATEVQLAATGTNIRLNDYLGTVMEFYMWVGQTTVQIWKQFAPDHMQVRVTMGRVETWRQFKRTDLLPGYDLEVFLPTPGEERRRAADIQNTIHLFAQTPQIASILDWEVVATEALIAINPGHTDINRYFINFDQRLQQEIAMEHEKLMNGEQWPVAPTQPHGIHIEQHQRVLQQLGQQVGQNPEMQEAFQQIQFVFQQHIEQHQQMSLSPHAGRRRNQQFNRTGNPGTPESIISAELSGG